jgi:hypothetical protein
VFVSGVLVGAGIVHSYNMASSATDPGIYGPFIVITGLIICIIIGLTMREAKAWEDEISANKTVDARGAFLSSAGHDGTPGDSEDG